MVMQDPHNVRRQITPRVRDALLILQGQVSLLDEFRPRLQVCAQPSPAQLVSHRADAQGDARLLRSIIAFLTNSIPQLGAVADLLSSALKHALDSGANRHALLFHGDGQSQDQIAEQLLAAPRTTPASFHPHRFPVSIHIALSSLRLAIDYYLDRCIYLLRRLGLPDRLPNRRILPVQPIDHGMVEPRTCLERASVLLNVAVGHTFDAIYSSPI